MDSWIAQMCTVTSRRQFLAWLSILIAGVFVLALNARYARNFVEGPFAVQADALTRMTDIDSERNYYVSVVADKVVDTGIQEITTTTENGAENGKYVSAGYYAFLIGDHVLVVKSSSKPTNSSAGELKTIPGDLSSELFAGTDGQQLRQETFPFYLDTDGFRYPGYWSIGIGCAFLALFVRFGGRAWSRWRDASEHPVLKRVVEQMGDVVGISVDAERELRSSMAYRSGGIFVTSKYVIEKSSFRFNLFRFDDMLWAYKKMIQRRVNFIPTGKSYEAILVFYGGSEAFSGSEARVDEVLTYAASKAPWAVIGYSKELAAMFNKQTRDFCHAVEARRQQISASAS